MIENCLRIAMKVFGYYFRGNAKLVGGRSDQLPWIAKSEQKSNKHNNNDESTPKRPPYVIANFTMKDPL